MKNKLEIFLKYYLLITSIYLLGDGLVHVFDIKLISVLDWPQAPLIYSRFIGHLYGLFASLAALLGLEAARDLKKYKNFLYIVAIWLIIYGSHLIYISLTTDFKIIFKDTPSIFVWMDFYNLYLIFEAGLCFIFSILVFLWSKAQNKTNEP